MTTVSIIENLFVNGPFNHVHGSLGLRRRRASSTVGRRALVTILIGWVPLLVLVLTDTLRNQTSASSFITDVGVHARSLIAAPLLVLIEVPCLKRLDEIVVYFVHSGIVSENDRSRFERIVASTRSLMNSTLAEVLAIVLTYAIVVLLVRYIRFLPVRPWYLTGNLEDPSWAGWWYALVSVPLLLMLFFGWVWRVILWGRFLIWVANMKLRLVAAHPDRAAGLKFLNLSLFVFSPVAFSLGVVVAGAAANRVQYVGGTLEGLEKTIIALLVVVFVVFVGPLMAFVFKLHRQKMIGVFAYGELATDVGRSFEEKWLAHYDKFASGALEASDFSATTDLYGIVANVHQISVLPFDLRGLITLAVSTVLPFVPVVLMTIPLKELLHTLMRLLV